MERDDNPDPLISESLGETDDMPMPDRYNPGGGGGYVRTHDPHAVAVNTREGAGHPNAVAFNNGRDVTDGY